ncbi:MAG: 5-(carboxyamino)imidazole ribonucleotide mutase [Rhizobacter sp.]|nr:5-(carboxyamino)imidazole ribonucleotide mutase [Bacteriovorax sp.]
MKKTKSNAKPVVAVIMGSQSDWPTMKEACDVLDAFGIPYEKQILSAHRTPDEMRSFAIGARTAGLKVIIAGAGGAAHLPGMTAAYTTLPVIGVPVQSKILSGVDSLYSIVQMPKGIPVATVAIGNASNAGILAVQILSIEDSKLAVKIETFRQRQSQDVKESNKVLKKQK